MRPANNIGQSAPAFLRKLWKIVNDPLIDDLVGWSSDGESFVIRNPPEFCYNLLPIYYKHNNMSSFIRQLNMYGFHKISNEGCDKDEIRFYHQFFQQNEVRLLQHIKRKIGSSKPTEDKKVPIDHIGKVLSDVKQLKGKQETVDTQLATMKQENAALWRELALLRQKHMKQQQIVNKLIHFLVSLVHQQPSRTTISVKRRFPLMINDGPSSKLNRRTDASTSEGATIHEIHETTSTTDEPVDEVLIDEVPLVSSPNLQSPIVDTNDILDNILVENNENDDLPLTTDNNETTVDELLQQSDDMEFATPDLEEVITDQITNPEVDISCITPEIILPDSISPDYERGSPIQNIDEELKELDSVIQTPQVMLSSNGKSIIETAPYFSGKASPEQKVTPIPSPSKPITSKGKTMDKSLAVAKRTTSPDISKLINTNDFGLHLNSTQDELNTIKGALFDGGLTLDAKEFLDLFNTNEHSLPLDTFPLSDDDDWSNTNPNDNQLFSGSELISYNPNDVFGFDNLLENNDEDTSLLEGLKN